MLRYLFTNEVDTTPIDKQIEKLYEQMDFVGVDSDEYPTLIAHLTSLTSLKSKHARTPVSSDTIALIVGNMLIAGIVVVYENKHLMNSKGWTQLMKLRGT